MNRRLYRHMGCGVRLRSALLLLASLSVMSHIGQAQAPANLPAGGAYAAGAQPAIPAILQAFEKFEVVAMPAAHGEKDMDDFILSLVRDPRFPTTVQDIVVECGNMRLQPLLDRYIAGEEVSFAEVAPVWRDTTVQQMCGASGFYEELPPLIRSLNQHLPPANRLRVIAADPPIDWSKIHSYQDLTPFFDRDGNIASVMQREVLSKHRKALMLFGIFHLLHGGGPGDGDAVTRYERFYPGKTFVVLDIGDEAGDGVTHGAGLSAETHPLLIRAKSSRLGSASLAAFLTSPITTDQTCTVVDAFPDTPTRPAADYIDAFLDLGPRRAWLLEPLPADIALDRAYRSEWLRRMKLVGLPGPSTLEELDAQIVASAANPMLPPPFRGALPPELRSRMQQDCFKTKHPESAPPK